MAFANEFKITLLILTVFALGAALRRITWSLNAPFAIFMLLTGIVFGGLVNISSPDSFLAMFQVSDLSTFMAPQIILYILLPALLFQAAFEMDGHVFSKNLKIITILAGPMLLSSIIATAIFMVFVSHFSYQWSLVIALVFGALISNIDPAGVAPVLRQFGVSRRLATFLEGESLLNYGVSIVCFSIFATMLTQTDHHQWQLTTIIFSAVKILLGGLALGWVLSKLFGLWMARTFNDPITESSLSISLVYLCMLVAEGILHVSGIMALLVAGLYMNSYGRTKINHETFQFLQKFWQLLSSCAHTFIFFIVGFIVSKQISHLTMLDVGLIISVYCGIMGIRFVTMFLLLPFLKLTKQPLTVSEATVISWGGLRGALSLALALMIMQNSNVQQSVREQILLVTAGVVFMTYLINGTTMLWLLQLFGFNQSPITERLMFEGSRLKIFTMLREKVIGILTAKEIRISKWSEVTSELEYKVDHAQEVLHQLENQFHNSDKNMKLIGYWLQAFNIERQTYWDALRKGTLTAQAVRYLDANINHVIDQFNSGNHQGPALVFLDKRPWTYWFYRFFSFSNFIRNHWSNLLFETLSFQYDLARGKRLGVERVLKHFDNIKNNDPHIIAYIEDSYKQQLIIAIKKLEELRNTLPELTTAIETKLVKRTYLNIERDAYEQLRAQGIVDELSAQQAIFDVDERIKELLLRDKLAALPDKRELLSEISLFKNSTEPELEHLAQLSEEIILSKGDFLFHEGDKGDSLYFVVRGALQALVKRHNKQVVIGAFGGGDIFGEMALLTDQPRTASIQALTSATLIKINRSVIEEINKVNDKFIDEIWLAFSRHMLDTVLRSNVNYVNLDPKEQLNWVERGKRFEIAKDQTVKIPAQAAHILVLTGEIQISGLSLGASAFFDIHPLHRALTSVKGAQILLLPALSTTVLKKVA